MIYYKKRSWIKKIILRLKRSEFSIPPLFAFLKLFLAAVLSLFVFVYISYFILLPKFVNEENVENILNKYLSNNTKLTLDVSNLKVSPNYKFDINIKADAIKLKYPNNKDFIFLKDTNIDINLLTLFFGYIDLNKIKTGKVILNTDFTKNKKYICFEYFDLAIFDLKAHNSKFELRNIRVLCDEFLFNLYDENIKKNFYIISKDVKLSLSEQGKPVFIETKGIIKSSNHKISDYNLNLEFILKQNPVNVFKNIISKLNYNPFKYADEYKFYSDANVKLKISPSDKTNINGYVNLKDYTFSAKGMTLPKNNVLILFRGDSIKADFNFNLIKNQFIKTALNASLAHKNKFVELKINSNDINLADFKEVADVFCKIFAPKINTKDITFEGSAYADLYLKSDFKTILSKGKLNIKNAKITHKQIGLSLTNINSDINLENNKINILNTTAFVDKSKFYLKGTIDDKTNLNLNINSDLINIAQIINFTKTLPLAASFNPYFNDYIFKSGFLKINADIKGNFTKPQIKTNSSLNNLNVFAKPYKTAFQSKEVLISSSVDNNIFITLNNSILSYEKFVSNIPKIRLKVSNNEAVISKDCFYLNGIKTYFEGKIDLKQQTLLLNLLTSSLNKNDLFIIKDKDAFLKLNLLVSKTKIQILEGSIFNNVQKLADISGSIENFNTLSNLKISIDNKISLVVPMYQNLSFDVLGNAFLNGKIDSFDINANLNLSNVVYKELNLYVEDLILNVKNSNFYVNIANSKILDFNFDLLAQGKYSLEKVVVNSASFSSPYINLDAFQKYLNKAKIPSNFNIQADNIQGTIATLEACSCLINSVKFDAKLNDNILTVQKFSAEAFNGTIQGNLNINLNDYKVRTELILKGLNVRHLSREIKELSIAASGKLSALISAEFCGFEFNDIMKTLDGYVKFNINDGELSQFAKLEKFLQAGNILSQSILKLTLNSTISTITKQNTGYFKTIEGTLKIKDSIANIQYIKTQGINMSLYMTGRFNLLSRNASLRVYGKIPSSIVNVMGSIGSFSLNHPVSKMPDDAKEIINSITSSPFEKMMSAPIPQEDIDKIPPLLNQVSSTITREFIVLINGEIENISSIKYFKWRAKE